LGIEKQYLWCYYCEEASSPADDDTWCVFCPMCGNGNALPGDFMEWEVFQKRHPHYPKVPVWRTQYSLTDAETRRELEEAQHAQFN
jgi:hypothetical protein